MNGFRAPYRITTVYDRLKRRSELRDCDIAIEELVADREEDSFPAFQYDTARVWVRYKGFAVNVAGRLNDAVFSYQVSAYSDGTPWNPQGGGTMANVDDMIDWIIKKFDDVPRGRS
jgi:hypothetical protein